MNRPPPGFSAKQEEAEMDDALSSMVRMAFDDAPIITPETQRDAFFAQQQRFHHDNAVPPVPMPMPPQQSQQFYPPAPAFFAPPPAFVFQPMPPPMLMQQQQPLEPSNGGNRFPDFKYMRGREIAQIVRNQLRQVETGDEYADDYYFLQFQERKAAEDLETAPSSSADTGGGDVLSMLKTLHESTKSAHPLPVLANKQRQQSTASTTSSTSASMDAQAKRALQLQMKWFDKTNVLGRTLKSNIRTPKELIQLDDTGATRSSFASRGWELRQVSLDTADALARVKDLSQLLQAKRRALAMYNAGGQEWDDVRAIVHSLEEELHFHLLALAEQMGLRGADESGGDERLVNLLWLPKGRRLALQASAVLLPEHRRAFLLAASRLMVYFACTTPTAQAKKHREGLELDMRVARTLKQMWQETSELAQVKAGVQMLLRSNQPESLAFIVSTPGGAEVVQAMLFHGQTLADEVKGGDAEWSALFQEFIEMAERGIAARE